MAVYTDVTADQLSGFLSGYDVGGLLSCKGIAEGVENSNFMLHTTGGRFILTLYEKRVEAGDLPFFIGLMDHLASRGLNCPRPVRDRHGVALGALAGRPAAMVTFLDGVWIKEPGAAHCSALGRALAELHGAGADFGLRRPNALSVDGVARPVRRGRSGGRRGCGRSRRDDLGRTRLPRIALAARSARGCDPRRSLPR